MLNGTLVNEDLQIVETRFKTLEGINLRIRLARRATYRLWKSIVLSKAKSLIADIQCESPEVFTSSMPAIILSSFTDFSDFLVLSYLFREKDLTFVATHKLPIEKTLDWLRSVNHVLYVDGDRIGYAFFKSLFSILRDLNRSIVISPDATDRYAKNLGVDPVIIVRIAMAANVPIIPVRFTRQKGIKKRDVWIGKNNYISPRAQEFRDIFFKQRGARKFRNLSDEDLIEIGSRIFFKLKGQDKLNGAHI